MFDGRSNKSALTTEVRGWKRRLSSSRQDINWFSTSPCGAGFLSALESFIFVSDALLRGLLCVCWKAVKTIRSISTRRSGGLECCQETLKALSCGDNTGRLCYNLCGRQHDFRPPRNTTAKAFSFQIPFPSTDT